MLGSLFYSVCSDYDVILCVLCRCYVECHVGVYVCTCFSDVLLSCVYSAMLYGYSGRVVYSVIC